MSRSFVLVVEDDLATQRAVLMMLAALQYDASAVSTATSALATVKTLKPSIVIADVLLPEFDGLWLAEHLRALWPDLPVLLTTGAILPEVVFRQTRKLGVPLLAKPFTREELDRGIRAAFSRDPGLMSPADGIPGAFRR